MKRDYHIQGIGRVEMVKNRRSKHIRITVKPDASVRITLPYGTPYTRGISFLEKKREWIRANVRKMEEKYPYRKWAFPGINPFSQFHKIYLHPIPGEQPVSKVNGEMVEIGIPEHGSPEDQEMASFIRSVMIRILRSEASQYLPDRMDVLAKQHSFRYGRVSLRNMKSRWGSCSSSNNISLNIHLMQLPEHLRDGIILHELVHTRVKNHGPDFWNMLNRLTDYQAKNLQKELRKYTAINN